jgi:hypothetical protein
VATRMIVVAFEDGSEIEVPIREAEQDSRHLSMLHGPVVSARVGRRITDPDEEDRNFGRIVNRYGVTVS